MSESTSSVTQYPICTDIDINWCYLVAVFSFCFLSSCRFMTKTLSAVFICDITQHLQAFSFSYQFSHYSAFHFILQHESCLRMCRIHRSLRCCNVSKMLLVSWTLCRTSSFVTLSFQLIFLFCLQTHISNVDNLCSLQLQCTQVYCSSIILLQKS